MMMMRVVMVIMIATGRVLMISGRRRRGDACIHG